MIDINFKVLFTVELHHNFYHKQKCPDFVIAPSSKTMAILSVHGLIWKNDSHKLLVGVQTAINSASEITSFIPLESGMNLAFFLQCKNPLFSNYTNIPLGGPGNFYYFTNRNFLNPNTTKLFLTQGMEAYDGTKSYSTGDLVTDGGIVYEAIQPSSSPGTPPGGVANPYWISIDTNSYVTENDQVTWLPSVSTYPLAASQLSTSITVNGYNPADNMYTLPVILPTTISFPYATSSFSLDLSSLPYGKYQLTVDGTNQLIYLNDELGGKNIFGVIDIYNDANLPAAYQLIEPSADSQLSFSPPAYVIFFLNRSTQWAYILRGNSGAISDSNNVYKFDTINTSNNTIYSATPIPLSEVPYSFQLLKSGNTYNYLPCATPYDLALAPDNTYCSKIYLNY